MGIDENERRKEMAPRTAKINFAQIFLCARRRIYYFFLSTFPTFSRENICEHVEDQRGKKRISFSFAGKELTLDN